MGALGQLKENLNSTFSFETLAHSRLVRFINVPAESPIMAWHKPVAQVIPSIRWLAALD